MQIIWRKNILDNTQCGVIVSGQKRLPFFRMKISIQNFIIYFFLSLNLLNSGFEAHAGIYNLESDYTKVGYFELTNPGTSTAMPPSGDAIVIDTYTYWDTDASIGTKDTLIVNDTLTVTGNLNIGEGAILKINKGAVCIIYGSLILKNKVDLSIGAYLVVGGDLTTTGSKFTADINSSATVYVLGTVSTDIVGMDCNNPSSYVPYNDDPCNYGNIISMEDNENDSTGIYDLFVGGDVNKGVSPVYSELCTGGEVTISAFFETADSYQWCDSIGDVIEGEISYQFNPTESGEYFVKIYDTDFNESPLISHRTKVVGTSATASIGVISSQICPGEDAEFTLSGTDGATVFYTINGVSDIAVVLTGGTTTVTVAGATATQVFVLDSIITESCNRQLIGISDTVYVEDTEAPQITCPSDIMVSADAGSCSAINVDLGTTATDDNCGVASLTNDAPLTFPTGNTAVTWTVTDNAGLTAVCMQTVSVEPIEVIDIKIEDLGNSCQSGETGSTTTVVWDLTKLSGTNDWIFDYTIAEGATIVDSATAISATGDTQISFEIDNQTATSKTYTLTVSNVKDNCGSSETRTVNNSDQAVLYGVPDTGDIITN